MARSPAVSVLLLFLLGLVARTVFLVVADLDVDLTRGDAREYDELASAMAEGAGGSLEPWTKREPMYAALILVARLLPGPVERALPAIQILIGALLAPILFVGLRGVLSGSVRGIAAVWVAVCPDLVYLSAVPLRENLAAFGLVFHLALLVAGAHRGDRRLLVASVIVQAGLVLTDSRFLPLVFLTPLQLLLLREGTSPVRWGLAHLGGSLALIVPYVVALSLAADRPVLVTERVLDKWLPRAFGSTGPAELTTGGTDRAAWRGDWEEDRQARLESLEPEDRVLFESGRRPAIRTVEVWVLRLAEYWRFLRLQPEYRPYPDGRFVPPWSKEHQWVATLSVVPLLLLAPFALRVRGEVARKALLALFLVLCAHVLLHVVVHARARYRLPVEPLWAVIAAAGLVALLRGKRRDRRRQGVSS